MNQNDGYPKGKLHDQREANFRHRPKHKNRTALNQFLGKNFLHPSLLLRGPPWSEIIYFGNGVHHVYVVDYQMLRNYVDVESSYDWYDTEYRFRCKPYLSN